MSGGEALKFVKNFRKQPIFAARRRQVTGDLFPV